MNRLRQPLILAFCTLILSIVVSLGSNSLLTVFPFSLSIGLLFFVILVGILFDIVGVAATAALESPFHAMASHKVLGAKHGIWLVKNADRVAAFSSDVVGDVAGTLSGALSATLVIQLLVAKPGLNDTLATTLAIALVAALTVGGKTFGKGVAIARCTDIVYGAARVLVVMEQFGVKVVPEGKCKKKRK